MPYGKMESIKKRIMSYRLFTLPVLCLWLSLVTLPQTSCAPTTPKPTQNITVTVPEGTQSHGNPNLLCTPARWTDIAVFFLANYVAHAATIKSVPGEPALITLRVLVSALCLPVSGVMRGVKAIKQRAVFSSTPLETAAKAGALCVVVRTPEWTPQNGDVACVTGFKSLRSLNTQPSIDREEVCQIPQLCIRGGSRCFLPSNSIFKSKGRKVHGICCLPHGYALATLPARAPITEIRKDKRDRLEIPKLSPWCRQLKDALRTLRHTRDDRPAMEDGIELRVLEPQANDPSNPYIHPAIELSSNYNLPKGLIAIFQTLYASATLYRTRGDQIQRYGYAAFGLTAAPYVVMSIINLLGTMLTPDYPCVYLVRSEIMDEASRRKGAKFEGMVATLIAEPVMLTTHVDFCTDEDDRIFVRGPRESMSQRGLRDAKDVASIEILKPDTGGLMREPNEVGHPTVCISGGLGVSEGDLSPEQFDWIEMWASIIVGSIPIAINGGLSHFSRGHSTIEQRAWTMTWLAFGLCFGLLGPIYYVIPLWSEIYLRAIFFIPAIGGFVVVGQMLISYGQCAKIGEASI